MAKKHRSCRKAKIEAMAQAKKVRPLLVTRRSSKIWDGIVQHENCKTPTTPSLLPFPGDFDGFILAFGRSLLVVRPFSCFHENQHDWGRRRRILISCQGTHLANTITAAENFDNLLSNLLGWVLPPFTCFHALLPHGRHNSIGNVVHNGLHRFDYRCTHESG